MTDAVPEPKWKSSVPRNRPTAVTVGARGPAVAEEPAARPSPVSNLETRSAAASPKRAKRTRAPRSQITSMSMQSTSAAGQLWPGSPPEEPPRPATSARRSATRGTSRPAELQRGTGQGSCQFGVGAAAPRRSSHAAAPRSRDPRTPPRTRAPLALAPRRGPPPHRWPERRSRTSRRWCRGSDDGAMTVSRGIRPPVPPRTRGTPHPGTRRSRASGARRPSPGSRP